METVYRAYTNTAEFLFVYVREAHPSDGRQALQNVREGVVFKAPATTGERAVVATECVKSLKLSMPFALDDTKNTVQSLYNGWPARTCIVGADGRILWISESSPRGVDPDEIKRVLSARKSRPDPVGAKGP